MNKAELDRLHTLTIKACKDASQEVIRTAIRYGTPIVVEQNGKVVEIEPNTVTEIEPNTDFVLFRVIDSGSN